MSNRPFQSQREKEEILKPVIVNTTAEKLKAPEYSVDKSSKKPNEIASSIPNNRKT